MLIFRTASLVEFPAKIRRRYDIGTTCIWHHDIILTSYRRHVFIAITVITCTTALLHNSSICLRSKNIQSVFNFVIIVVTITPYLFIFRSIKGGQLVILFGFCVRNFFVKVVVTYWFYNFIMIDSNRKISLEIIRSRKYTTQTILSLQRKKHV